MVEITYIRKKVARIAFSLNSGGFVFKFLVPLTVFTLSLIRFTCLANSLVPLACFSARPFCLSFSPFK